MAQGYKPGPPPGDRGAADAAPRTRRWAPRANADAALPPLGELGAYAAADEDEFTGADDDFDADAFAAENDRPDTSESETGEQDRPNLDRIEHGGTEEFSAPTQRPRSGKRRASQAVLMPREVEGPPRDAVSVPTRIEEPRIDLDLSLARRDEDETSVPPSLRGRNLPADRERTSAPEERPRTRDGKRRREPDDDRQDAAPARRSGDLSGDDLMIASLHERSGSRIWVVVAILGGIGLIALLLALLR